MKKKILLLLILLQCFSFKAQADTLIAVHGFLTNWRAIKPLRKALCPLNFDLIFWEYPSRRRCLQQHGADLADHLRQLAEMQPGVPIHFLTHSIGALVLRSALNHPLCPNEAKIGRAVLLAPPSQGSCLGRKLNSTTLICLAMGDKSGWQIMHYDPCQIAQVVGELPPCMQVLVIAGTKGNKLFFDVLNDGMLTVEETRTNTPSLFMTLPLNHSELLTDPSSISQVCAFLSGSCV